MEILKILSEKGNERGISFLLIGGIALGVYGISRQTGDVDILIREEDREQWKEVIQSLGYRLFHDHTSFLQFTPPRIDTWPLDAMIVNGETFDRLRKEAKAVDFRTARVLVPEMKHLLALKIHALKQEPSYREFKDLGDIIALVERAGMDVDHPDFSQMCSAYGTQEIYERIRDAWKKRRDDSPSSEA